MKKTIVILSGKAGAGKDTFAAMLGGAWQRISFADEVKKKASELVDLHLDFFHDVDKKDNVMLIGGKYQTPRDLLISVGMYYRGLDLNYWINMAVEKIRSSKSEFFVITDWRFPNELEALRLAFNGDVLGYRAARKAYNEDRFNLDAGQLELDFRVAPTMPETTAEISTVRIVGREHLGSSHESECALDSFRFDSLIINRASLELLEGKAKLLRAKVGEEEMLAEIYTELYPKATNLCRKHTSNPSDLKDVTQEALYEVIKQFKAKFNFNCTLWTFAYKVIYYYAQNYRRKREAYLKHFTLADGNTVEHVGNSGKSDLYMPFLGDKIDAAMHTLSDFDRKLVTLRHDGWSHK